MGIRTLEVIYGHRIAVSHVTRQIRLAIIFVLTLLYFLPVIVGWSNRNRPAIFVVNIFLGWTIIGWVVALTWAATKD
jgi:hypothetical protein